MVVDCVRSGGGNLIWRNYARPTSRLCACRTRGKGAEGAFSAGKELRKMEKVEHFDVVSRSILSKKLNPLGAESVGGTPLPGKLNLLGTWGVASRLYWQ